MTIDVIVIDNFNTGKKENLISIENKIELHTTDIRDKERYRDPSMNDAIDDRQNDLDWFREKYKISQNSNFYISEKVCVSVFAPGWVTAPL